MRILALVFVLLLGMPVVTAQTALAQSGADAQQPQANVDDVRTQARGALNTARQFLGGLFADAKEASGLNDEQRRHRRLGRGRKRLLRRRRRFVRQVGDDSQVTRRP